MSCRGMASQSRHSRGEHDTSDETRRSGGILRGGAPAFGSPFPLASPGPRERPSVRSSGPVFGASLLLDCRRFRSLRLAPDDPKQRVVVQQRAKMGQVLLDVVEALALIARVKRYSAVADRKSTRLNSS